MSCVSAAQRRLAETTQVLTRVPTTAKARMEPRLSTKSCVFRDLK